MIKKTKKFILIALSIFILSGLFIYIAFDIVNDIKCNSKKEGFDILLANTDICTLSIDKDTLWAGGSDGLYKINMNDLTSKKVGDYKFVRVVLVIGDNLWVGHEDGLTCIGDSIKTFTTKDGLPDNRVNALMSDRDKHLWVGTWGGAAVFFDKAINTYTTKNGLLADMVNVLMQDSHGGIWFGNYVAPRGGISILYNDKWQYFTTDNALLHANVNAIIQRSDKRVVAGGGLYTKGGGTYFAFENGKWVKNTTITKATNGLAGEKVRSLFEDSQNRLWVGSEYDGLVALQDKHVIIKLTKESGLSNNEVKAICEDIDNNIWIGTRDGLTRISKEVISSIGLEK